MGLSRNKVAVPEGAAGTPPFWRRGFPTQLDRSASEGQVSQRERLFQIQIIKKEERLRPSLTQVRTSLRTSILAMFIYSSVAQLVRAPH